MSGQLLLSHQRPSLPPSLPPSPTLPSPATVQFPCIWCGFGTDDVTILLMLLFWEQCYYFCPPPPRYAISLHLVLMMLVFCRGCSILGTTLLFSPLQFPCMWYNLVLIMCYYFVEDVTIFSYSCATN